MAFASSSSSLVETLPLLLPCLVFPDNPVDVSCCLLFLLTEEAVAKYGGLRREVDFVETVRNFKLTCINFCSNLYIKELEPASKNSPMFVIPKLGVGRKFNSSCQFQVFGGRSEIQFIKSVSSFSVC